MHITSINDHYTVIIKSMEMLTVNYGSYTEMITFLHPELCKGKNCANI